MTYPGKQESRPAGGGSLMTRRIVETNGIGRCAACHARYVPVFPGRDEATANQLLCRLCIRDAVPCGYCRAAIGRCVGCDTVTEGHIVESAIVCFSCIPGFERWA